MAFVSIGQKYGFVSAGDVFRQRLAAGKAEALAEGISKGLSKGRKEGLSKGLSKGRAEGLSKGLSKGRAEGIRQGLSKGRKEEKLSLAKAFRNKGFPLETIAEVTGLSIDEIKAL